MTTNIAESLNSLIKTEKGFPIYALLIAIQNKLAKWFCKRRTFARNNKSSVTPTVAAELLQRYQDSRCMPCDRLNEFEFHVRGIGFDHIVNLSLRECSCRVFNIDRIPCEYAIAALKLVYGENGENMTEQIENLCHRYYSNDYWAQAYEKTIYPTPHIAEWIMLEDPSPVSVKPPNARMKRGRKKTIRIPSIGEFHRPPRKRKRCSRCHQPGHYKRKCMQQVEKDV